MLDLRGLYFSERSPRAPGGPDAPASAETTFSVKMSDIRFDTSRIIGNMGATLSEPRFTSFVSSDSSELASTGDVESHLEGIEDIKRSGEADRWYEDEKPIFASDPFREGLQPPVVVNIELKEPISPLSPLSPVSPVASTSPLYQLITPM